MLEQTLDISAMDGPLGQRVHSVLREKILDLTLEPGAVLRKGVLCEQLGVSRSPVAEALGKLSSEGLVDIIPQSATRVSRFSMAEILEENFLREAVETAAITQVATRRTEDQLLRLSRNIRLQTLLVEDADHQGFFEADLEFHGLILSFTGFASVPRIAEDLTLQLRRARKLALPSPGRAAEALAEHLAIFRAIEARDVEAATTALTGHLRHLVQTIEPLERRFPDYFRR